MKLVTFTHDGGAHRLGALIDDGNTVVDLQAGQAGTGREDPAFTSMMALIQGGDDALARAYDVLKTAGAGARISRDAVKLLAPIQPPPMMRDFLCFEEHLINAYRQARKVRAQQSDDPEAAMRDMEERNVLSIPQEWYAQPLCYKPNPYCVIGTDEDIVWPAYSNLMDYELEFGFYVKKAGRDIKRENARNYIFGYTIFNDVSARDTQTREMPGMMGPGKGKDFDTGNVMGPCIVTADEMPDPYRLTMTARVNGEVWGGGTTADMHWKFEDLIAHISQSETLVPGEFFGSGTVGTGCGLEIGRFLKPGDVVELEVEGIGILRNRIVKH